MEALGIILIVIERTSLCLVVVALDEIGSSAWIYVYVNIRRERNRDKYIAGESHNRSAYVHWLTMLSCVLLLMMVKESVLWNDCFHTLPFIKIRVQFS